jgi:hypothetical protein
MLLLGGFHSNGNNCIVFEVLPTEIIRFTDANICLPANLALLHAISTQSQIKLMISMGNTSNTIWLFPKYKYSCCQPISIHEGLWY